MAEALGQGGTSFDALYVNVNGASGYFDRSLHAYGRAGTPCDRCGTHHAPRAVHEPLVVLLPRLPAAPETPQPVLTVGDGGRAATFSQVGPSADRAVGQLPVGRRFGAGRTGSSSTGSTCVGHDDRLDPRPDDEDAPMTSRTMPAQRLALMSPVLAYAWSPKSPMSSEDHAVDAEQGADEVADVEGAGRVLLPRAVGVRASVVWSLMSRLLSEQEVEDDDHDRARRRRGAAVRRNHG